MFGVFFQSLAGTGPQLLRPGRVTGGPSKMTLAKSCGWVGFCERSKGEGEA